MNQEDVMSPNQSPIYSQNDPLTIKARLLEIKRLGKKPLIIGSVIVAIVLSSLLWAISTRGVRGNEEDLSGSQLKSSSMLSLEANPATQILGWDDNTSSPNQKQNFSQNGNLSIEQNQTVIEPPKLLPIPQIEETYSPYQSTQTPYTQPSQDYNTFPATQRLNETKNNPQERTQEYKKKLFEEAIHSPTMVNWKQSNQSNQSISSSQSVTEAQNTNTHSNQSLLQSSQNNDYLANSKKPPLSPYEIRKGTIIPSVLIGSINSELPSDVIAQVSENVYDSKTGKYLLIPQGSKLVGLYSASVAYGQSRLMIVWYRINFPDGKRLDIGNMNGIDQSGKGGFNDVVDNHYLKIFSSAFLISLITGEFSVSNTEVSINGTNSPYGNRVSQTGEKMLEKNMAISPTLEIRSGYRFNIFVNKDVILEPL